MSLLFADVYDGIRTVRIQKGASEKDILNYVQEKVGGCMKVSNVLKTIRTMKQLCQDGVLVKNGKRYAFAPKPEKPKEEENDEEGEEGEEGGEDDELDMDPDDCEKDDGDGEDEDEDNGEDEEEEEEEEEEDDDEDEDEDEDDDDKGECDEKEPGPEAGGDECEMSSEEQKENEDTGNEDTGNEENCNDRENTCGDTKINRVLVSEDRYGKRNVYERVGKRDNKPVINQDGDSKKGSEAIAFCVRDFIDSLGRSNTREKQEEQRKSEEVQENMDGANIMQLGKTQPRKRALRNKRKTGRQSGRVSKSPRKEVDTEMFHSLGQGHSVETGLRAVSSEFFQEPGDADMDVDMEKDTAFDVHHRTTMGPTSLNLLGGMDTLCMETEKKIFENVKTEQSFEDLTERVEKNSSHTSQVQTTNCQIPQMTWFPLEDNEKDPEEPMKRAESTDDDERHNVKSESLCSVCEKKKRSS